MHQISSVYAGMCVYDHTCGDGGFDTHIDASNEEGKTANPHHFYSQNLLRNN